nr:spore coat CotO family protein [Neobacillus sp. Marseille-Q6967]
MEKKTKMGPLLYISQPFTKSPANNMQEIFTNRQEVQLPVEEPQAEPEIGRKKVLEVSLAKTETADRKPQEVKQVSKEQIKQEVKRPAFNRLKGFKEMNIHERIKYLINFPKALPPVPCIFCTEEKKYQGYLLEQNEQEIQIKLPDQTTQAIPVEELKDIIMIGLKA